MVFGQRHSGCGCSVAAFENATRMPAAKSDKNQPYQSVMARLHPRRTDDTRQPGDTGVPHGLRRLRKSSSYPAAGLFRASRRASPAAEPKVRAFDETVEGRRELGEIFRLHELERGLGSAE